DAYLGVTTSSCDIKQTETRMPDKETLPNGQVVRVDRVMIAVDVRCPVILTVASPADGNVISRIEVTGTTGHKLSTETTEAEGLASEDAAKQAAKKLVAALK